MRNINKMILFLIFSATLGACGIKGPPLPPLREETIQKQKTSEIVSADASKAQPQNTK